MTNDNTLAAIRARVEAARTNLEWAFDMRDTRDQTEQEYRSLKAENKGNWGKSADLLEHLNSDYFHVFEMLPDVQALLDAITALEAALTERDRELAAARERVTAAEAGLLLDRVHELLETLFIFPVNTDALVWVIVDVEGGGQSTYPLLKQDADAVFALKGLVEDEHAARQPDGGEQEA